MAALKNQFIIKKYDYKLKVGELLDYKVESWIFTW